MSQLGDALKNTFKVHTGTTRALSKSDLEYLMEKLLRHPLVSFQGSVQISLARFCKVSVMKSNYCTKLFLQLTVHMSSWLSSDGAFLGTYARRRWLFVLGLVFRDNVSNKTKIATILGWRVDKRFYRKTSGVGFSYIATATEFIVEIQWYFPRWIVDCRPGFVRRWLPFWKFFCFSLMHMNKFTFRTSRSFAFSSIYCKRFRMFILVAKSRQLSVVATCRRCLRHRRLLRKKIIV